MFDGAKLDHEYKMMITVIYKVHSPYELNDILVLRRPRSVKVQKFQISAILNDTRSQV